MSVSRHFVVPIVEGHGEVEAVPILLRKIATSLYPSCWIDVNPPIRTPASGFLNFEIEFRKRIELAANKAKEYEGFVLIILDCEDSCPAELGPKIAEEALKVRPDVNFVVALAYREFETWLVYSLPALAGMCGISTSVTVPTNPERSRDAKGLLQAQMNTAYCEVDHQPAFTSRINLDLAMRSNSFEHLIRSLDKALNQQ